MPVYVFGRYELDTQLYELRCAGVPIRLGPKVFSVLEHLVRHRHRVVTKQELIAHLWPDQFVSETALARCIVVVRKAFGDGVGTQQIIQTLYGHGYRFIAAVEERHHTPLNSPAPSSLLPQAEEQHLTRLDAVSDPSSPPPDGAWDGRQQGNDTPRPIMADAPPMSSPAFDDVESHTAWNTSRQVTVLACALGENTARVERLDPEAQHDLMYKFLDLALREVQRYEGTIQRFTDDGFVALFGVPPAHEEHARRALLAAVEIRRGLRERGTAPLPLAHEALVVHMGVHTGPVVRRRIADDNRAVYLAVGNTMRLAARLQQLAPPDTILASEAVVQLMQGRVRVEAFGAIPDASDLPAPSAYIIRQVKPRRTALAWRGTRSLTPFAGRGQELAILPTLLRQVAGGQGQVVGVMGEPGIGKSRLVNEFRHSLHGQSVTYLQGRCVAHGQTTPYLPVLGLLRHACGITNADGPDVLAAKVHRNLERLAIDPETSAPYVLHLLGVPAGTALLDGLNPHVIRSRTFEILIQMSLQSSRQRPLVLQVEDLHWIDMTSAEWLTALARRLAGVAILLLVTYRPGFLSPWIDGSYATQMALLRLTPRESQQVAQAAVRTARISGALMQRILAQANGNPSFLEELARTVVEQGETRQTLTVPEAV